MTNRWFKLLLCVSSSIYSTARETVGANKLCKMYKVDGSLWSNNQIKASVPFLWVVSGKWLPKWAFGLMHYGKDKGSAKTIPSVPLRRGKAPDKHMVYSILLSLGGPQQWAIQWGVPLRTGCLYLHFIIANRCPPPPSYCFMSAQFHYWCPFDKALVGLCHLDYFFSFLLPFFLM